MPALDYRSAIGIIVVNAHNKVLLCRRNDMKNQWQFPQGGIDPPESPQAAVLRELNEETRIPPSSVAIIGNTQEYMKYDYPANIIQQLDGKKKWQFAGQQVQFFLLRFLGSEQDIDVESVRHPEFDAWRWVDYWEPVKIIVEFKREVYVRALTELAMVLQLEVAG